jgi:poly-gamma-glutamate capsule biosynthesis protein CapA/YwtB (metallophosphatase superfamily)
LKNKFLLLVLIFLIFSCRTDPGSSSNNRKAGKDAQQAYSINFAAVGDNLFHESLLNSHLKNNVYDFSPIYTEIKSIIQNADLAFINQETPMAGESFGYSGYPAFNSPQSLAKTHVETGFDIVNLANNHAMDKGASGLYATLDYLNTIKEFTVIGARKEGQSARIVTKNNITLGFLSYAYGLNGNTLPKDNPNLVSLISRKKIEEEATALRPLCDFLVVSMHWGDEYMLQPNKEQIDLAAFLASLNVDLIIGHHPHVLQRVEAIKRPDGKETICYYSLGNFVSHQRERERIIGALMALTFVKQSTGELSIINYGILPLITHYDRAFSNTKIYPLYSYTEQLLNEHALKNAGDGLSFAFFNGVTDRLNAQIFKSAPFMGK